MRPPGLINSGSNLTLWSRDLDAYLRSITPRSSGGIMVSRGPNGTTFGRGPNGTSSSPSQVAIAAPFFCTLYPWANPDGTPAGNKVGVEFDSKLFKSKIPLTPFYGITGLNDPLTPFLLDLDGPDVTDGYISPNGPDDYVFLDISFDSTGYAIQSVAVDTNGNGSTIDPTYSAWDDSGDALVAWDTSTPPKQTKARIVLAEYRDGKIWQLVHSHLVMEWDSIDGNPGYYPAAYP